MKNEWNRYEMFNIVLCFTWIMMFSICSSANIVIPKEIMIGGNIPMSLNNGIIVLKDTDTPFRLAVDNINNDTSLLPNTKLTYTELNTALSPDLAARNTILFEELGLEINYCCLSSGGTSLSAPASALYQMIQLGPYTCSDALSDRRKFPYFNQIVPQNRYQAIALFELLNVFYNIRKQKQYLEIGIICSATEYGLSGANAMINNAPNYNISVIAYQQFVSAFLPNGVFGAPVDVTVEITELKASKSRIFVGIMEPNDFVAPLNKANELGLIGPNYIWLCFDGCASPYAFVNLATKQVNQQMQTQMWGIIGVNQSGFKGAKYDALIHQINSVDPTIYPIDYYPPQLPFQYIYDGVYFLANAMNTSIYEGGFTEDGKIVNKTRFNEILHQTIIDGVTGLIQLTDIGVRVPAFDLVNLHQNQSTMTIIGSWNESNISINESELQFYGGGTTLPDLDIREPYYYWSCEKKSKEYDATGKSVVIQSPEYSNPNLKLVYHCDHFVDCENLSDESVDCSSNYRTLYIVFGVVTGCLILISLIYLIFTIIFGFFIKRKRILSASPFFLIIIIISGIVGYSSIFAWYGKSNKVACGFQPWLLGLSLNSMIAALCSKTFRIWRIFKSPFDRKVISDFELFILWCLIMLPAIIILILWTSISTPTTVLKNVNSENHWVCDTGGVTGPPGGWIFFSIFVAYSGLVLIFGAFLSIVTRNVPALFNESKLISISIYHLVFISVSIIPVVIVLNSINPYISWIIRSAGILYAFTATLAIQFLPKIVNIVYFDRFQNINSSIKSLNDLEKNTNTNSALSNIPEARSMDGEN